MDLLNKTYTDGDFLLQAGSQDITDKLNEVAAFFGKTVSDKLIDHNHENIREFANVLNIYNDSVLNLAMQKNDYNANDSIDSTVLNGIISDINQHVAKATNTSKETLNGSYTYPSWWQARTIPVTFVDGVPVHSFNIKNEPGVKSVLSRTQYYMAPGNRGSNSNDGLSPDTPIMDMWKLFELGAENIILLEGVYNASQFGTLFVKNDLALVAQGDVMISSHADAAWVPYNSIFSTTDTIYSIIDRSKRDAFGDRYLYEFKSTIAEVEAEVGTWTTDGATSYVNPFYDTFNLITTTNYKQEFNFNVANLVDSTFYIEGVTFSNNFWCEYDSDLTYAKNVYLNKVRAPYPCRNDHDPLTNAVWQIHTDGVNVIAQECFANRSNRDGMNYHNAYRLIRANNSVIEVDCISINPSYRSLDISNQASSSHHGIPILRIGGLYAAGYATIKDVNLGLDTKSVLIGSTVNQNKKFDPAQNLYILSTASYGEAYGCNLFGTLPKNNTLECNEAGGRLDITECYSEHNWIEGNVIIN